MKKIILSLLLAATAFNGWLAASGSASLSASELQVDGVEMMAEAETDIWPIVAAVTGVAALGFTIYTYCTRPEPGTHWAPEEVWDACLGRFVTVKITCIGDQSGEEVCVAGSVRHLR